MVTFLTSASIQNCKEEAGKERGGHFQEACIGRGTLCDCWSLLGGRASSVKILGMDASQQGGKEARELLSKGAGKIKQDARP